MPRMAKIQHELSTMFGENFEIYMEVRREGGKHCQLEGHFTSRRRAFCIKERGMWMTNEGHFLSSPLLGVIFQLFRKKYDSLKY